MHRTYRHDNSQSGGGKKLLNHDLLPTAMGAKTAAFELKLVGELKESAAMDARESFKVTL